MYFSVVDSFYISFEDLFIFVSHIFVMLVLFVCV